MRPSDALNQHREEIRRIVADAGLANPRVFGSVARGEDQEDSDLDILVDPAPRMGLLKFSGVQIRLEELLGLKVDLLTPNCLPVKFRQHAISEALAL